MRPEGWFTFGLRGQLRTVKASKEQRLPLRMMQLCDELSETWGYSLFGTRTIITRDQRNIQAVLATQFDGWSFIPGSFDGKADSSVRLCTGNGSRCVDDFESSA
jgi:hypothetical protein